MKREDAEDAAQKMEAMLREAGIDAVTDGESPRVTGQLPPAGTTVQAGFCAMLYVTGETAPQAQDYARVSDVMGMGMLDCAQRVFGLHTASDLPAGTVGVKPGANNAGVDHFIIRIHGKSAHVSTPQLGVDALYIASELVVALQSIVTRMTSPVEPVLIGVGKLNAGTAYNAVAETAVLEGTPRMFSPESRAHLRETINAAAAHISALYGGTAEVEWDDFATPLTNDAGVCVEVERVADALGIPTTANRALSLSGDDFAEYLLQTKGAYAYLGTANPKKPHTCISNHRGDFDIDEETLPLGAALYAAYALSVLDPQFAK